MEYSRENIFRGAHHPCGPQRAFDTSRRAPEQESANWIFEYYPRPGERLNVKVTRALASASGTLAFDGITLETAAGELTWLVDQAAEHLPTPGVLSVSLWWYKLAILAWALWLSFALTRWTRWAWEVFAREGLWRRPSQPSPPAAQPAPS